MPASVAKRGSLSARRSTISSAKAKIADWAVCSDIGDPLGCAIVRETEIYTVAQRGVHAAVRPRHAGAWDYRNEASSSSTDMNQCSLTLSVQSGSSEQTCGTRLIQ